MKVIGLIGYIGSGKDTVAEYLVKKYKLSHVSYGDIVRELSVAKSRTKNRSDLIRTQKEYVKKYGHSYFGKIAVKKIKENGGNNVLSGIRRFEDIKEPMDAFGKDFLLIFIDSGPRKRFERMKRRKREGDPKTFEEFLRQEKEENKAFDIDKIMKYVRFTISNDGTLQELHKNIDNFLAKTKIKS